MGMNEINTEHRTPNIERRMMTGGAGVFIRCSMFDVQRSMFLF
jgi:hypothetical protein